MELKSILPKSAGHAARQRLRLVLGVIGVGLALGLTACGQGGTELSDGASADDIETGRTTYERSCSACHGVGGQGTNQGPPFIDRIYEPSHHADAAFLLAVQNGVRAHHWNFGDMPRQEGLTDEDVGRIVAYVRDIQRQAGIE